VTLVSAAARSGMEVLPDAGSGANRGGHVEVELTAEESDALRQALQSYLSDLRMEITNTDNASYKHELRDERAALESVAQKLTDAAASTEERDTEGRAVIRFVAVWFE
jgi:3-oxoacyl-ACP reductase-like protein